MSERAGWRNSGLRGQPDGYYCEESHVEKKWYNPFGTMIYKFMLHPDHPLTFVHPNGAWIQPGKYFLTDKASVPWWATWMLPRDRFLGPFVHDFAYKYGYVWRSLDQGASWYHCDVTRKQADVLLRVMVQFDPYPATFSQAWAMYAGVRAGGWTAWGKKCLEKKPPKMKLPVTLE